MVKVVPGNQYPCTRGESVGALSISSPGQRQVERSELQDAFHHSDEGRAATLWVPVGEAVHWADPETQGDPSCLSAFLCAEVFSTPPIK